MSKDSSEKLPPASFQGGEENRSETSSTLSDKSYQSVLPGNVPRQIGPYRLLQELGHGGMGIIYEAVQEKPVHRRVALKLIKWGMDTKAVIGRFESERQALALMNHPNIASVYDAGATQQGRPYFAMELVRGEPITTYCDKNRLTVQERLDLFIDICGAVQHAHQKGIIHRDIKPSNILVTIQNDRPVPKIIDFGVAKATSQRLTEQTVFTELGQVIGTPEYMSPEQAEMTGIDIDTRTDVYSLGVVLYELLVGTNPFENKSLRQTSPDEMRRRIREEEPVRPSTQLSRLGEASTTAARNRQIEKRVLKRELNGDLDWITMKALEKDRTRRYISSSELAEDIKRHLKHEPVLAGPPSTIYRTKKFVRRHKVGVAAAALALLALLIGVMGTTVGMIRAVRAEKAAMEKAAQAKAINDFMQETLGSANPVEGKSRDITLLEVLESSVDKIHDSFTDQPEIEAELKLNIGITFLRLGHYDKAEVLLKESLDLFQIQVGAEDQRFINCLNSLAIIKHELGDYEGAENYYRQALKSAIQANGEEHSDVTGIMSNLGLLLEDKGDLTGADKLFRKALRIDRKIFGDRDLNVAIDINNLGNLLLRKKEYEESELLLNEACSIFREAQHPFLAMCMGNQGRLLTIKGDYQKAESILAQALSLQLNSFGEKNQDLATIRYKYGSCLLKLNKLALAEEQLEMAFTILRQTLGIQSSQTQQVISELAKLYVMKGDLEKETQYNSMLK